MVRDIGKDGTPAYPIASIPVGKTWYGGIRHRPDATHRVWFWPSIQCGVVAR